MYAVIRTGGKQYRVAEGDLLRVEKLDAEQGAAITFDQVLMLGGETVSVGTPVVAGGEVTAEVVSHGRSRKVDVVKFRRRKNYLRRHGHRQNYTEVRITGIRQA